MKLFIEQLHAGFGPADRAFNPQCYVDQVAITRRTSVDPFGDFLGEEV